MNPSPVVIVSAFGRGQGLAARLADREIPVLFIDITQDLGDSAPEDEEGPFGVFLNGLSEESFERIHQGDPVQVMASGWTAMLADGPLEMKSPLTRYRLERLGAPASVLDVFRDVQGGNVKGLAPWMSAEFDKSWILHLSASLAANTLRLFPEALSSAPLLPLDGDFGVRSVTRPGLAEVNQWCGRRGVQIRRDLIVEDLAREGRSRFKGLQYRLRSSQTTEILSFERLVWCLSGEETRFLSPDLGEKIFPEGVLAPSWVWTRFRLRLEKCPEREILPLHSVWIRDADLPWTHENLMILQKSPAPDLIDAWIRIPAEQRLQKAYLHEKAQKILAFLNSRLVTAEARLSDDPLPSEKTTRELGPSRQPIFDSGALLSWRAPREENFHLHAPEVWSGLGWNFLFRHEEKISAELESWWKRREELRIKREQKGRKP